MDHTSGEVRESALQVLQMQQGTMPLARFEELLEDDLLAVRVEAMSVQQLTQVSTNYTLKGIEIKAVWKAPDGTFHCLGVLDRVGSAQTLRGEIQRLDAQIQAAVQEINYVPVKDI